MNWNIRFNNYTAEQVYESVKLDKHLIGFDNAESKLNTLKNKLEELFFDANWWKDKCENAAVHYENMQRNLYEHPEDFSEENVKEANSKSPQLLYDIANALEDGTHKLQGALSKINYILKNLKLAKDESKDESKKVLDKISNAIDLMEKYLGVNF